MDIQTNRKMASGKALSELAKKRTVVGAKQLRKALQKGVARCVYLAQNADPAITEPLEALCRNGGVSVMYVATMAELGRVCGIEVGAAAAAVVD